MKIIFFSSHTATWYYAIAEAAIAAALQKKGHDIVFITPGRLFKEISNIKQEKILRSEFALKGYEIGTVLIDSDYKKIDSIINKLNNHNFDDLIIDGIRVGKLAIYEFLLHDKKMTSELTKSEFNTNLDAIKNSLISFFACKKIIEKEKPDNVIIYGDLYSVNSVWVKYSESKNIPVYFIQHGLNFSDINNTLTIARTSSVDFFRRLVNVLSKMEHTYFAKAELSYVTDNFKELLKAKHFLVYSAPKSNLNINIRKFYGIQKNVKILTATMSSYDEMFSANYVGAFDIPKDLIFKSQAEWIRALINYVKDKPNLYLLIRVHPREFPNKRESVMSEHAKKIEKVFQNLPSNVKINWPSDKISIYDLAQETDVFLNAWSTVGVEMSLLGIPVVLYSKDLILYPSDLNYVGKSRNDYFSKIEIALSDGWSFEKIKKTYRWLALYYYWTITRFRKKGINKLSTAQYMSSLLSPRIRGFLIKIFLAIPGIGVGKTQLDDCRRQLKEHVDVKGVEKMLLNSEDTLVDINKILSQKITSKEEDIAIRKEIKRIYEAMYGNIKNKKEIKKFSLQYNLRQTF